MPHGRNVLVPSIMLSVAATLSLIVLCNCYFVQPEGSSKGYAGLWGNCVYSYPSWGDNFGIITLIHQDDPARVAAAYFGIMACIFGTGSMITLWPITCRPYSRFRINVIFGAVVFAFISQFATLSMFGTKYCKENSCRLGWGGVLSIVAGWLWLVSALGVFKIPEPINVGKESVVVLETGVAYGAAKV